MEPQTPSEQQYAPASQRQSVAIPVAIVVGFAMIAAAIYFSGNSKNAPTVGINDPTAQQLEGDPSAVNPITPEDHIRGNPNAPIVIVEYSDYDCPFCKGFHETMNRIMADYGADGKVAWVYRHFPLQQLHPNAATIALASECVAEQAGNDGFWKFSDMVFEERGTNEPTNITRLVEFATSAGANETEFSKCMDEGRYQIDIEADFNNAAAVGGRGTPHSIIMVGGEQGVINGAQPYATVKQIVENLLRQIEGQEQQ